MPSAERVWGLGPVGAAGARPRSGWLDVRGGRLRWDAIGDDIPIVCVHGFALDKRLWCRVLSLTPPDHRLITYDLRGFGRSTASDRHDEHTLDLEEVIRRLAGGSAHLVGHSLGGQIALEIALSRPELARSLTLVCSGLRGRPSMAVWRQVDRRVRELARGGDIEAARRAWMSSPMFQSLGSQPEILETVATMVRDYSGRHWLAPRRPEAPGEIPPSARLGEISVPTLVAVGTHDTEQAHATADYLASGIPGAGLRRLEGAGHFPSLEAPEMLWGIVLPFVDELESTRRAGDGAQL